MADNTLLLRCKESRNAVDVYREGVPQVVSAIEAILPDWDCNDYDTWTIGDVIAFEVQ